MTRTSTSILIISVLAEKSLWAHSDKFFGSVQCMVGMGVLPLVFNGNDTWECLGLDGAETFSIFDFIMC